MAVERCVGVAVLEDHGIAVATTAAGQQHLAITGSLDRRAARCSVVDAFVGADLVQDRVFAAHGKFRADAGEVHRCADERLAHAVAVSGVVTAVALFVGVAHGGVGLAAVGEARRQDRASADGLAVDHFLLVDHIELVALANILGEVHVVAKHTGHVHGQAVRQAGPGCGLRQRAVDHAVYIGGAHGRFRSDAIERVALVVLGQADAFEVAELAVQVGQLTLGAQFEFEFLPVLELAELLGLPVAGQHVMH
ncbi:hypothetical protein D3C78_723310 [compost metagenome]